MRDRAHRKASERATRTDNLLFTLERCCVVRLDSKLMQVIGPTVPNCSLLGHPFLIIDSYDDHRFFLYG